MKTLIVIPARLESKRLHRKLLLAETGKPLIQHTWEQACKTGLDVVIAVDSGRLCDVCRNFGADVLMTSTRHASGMERLTEVQTVRKADVYVDWQADEPQLSPSVVKDMVDLLRRDPAIHVATAYSAATREQMEDFDCTKIVVDSLRVLYFTRHPLPYAYHHVGVYAITSFTLQRFWQSVKRSIRSKIEAAERLEQMQFLNLGFKVGAVYAPGAPKGIDTQEDYDAFVARQKEPVG